MSGATGFREIPSTSLTDYLNILCAEEDLQHSQRLPIIAISCYGKG